MAAGRVSDFTQEGGDLLAHPLNMSSAPVDLLTRGAKIKFLAGFGDARRETSRNVLLLDFDQGNIAFQAAAESINERAKLELGDDFPELIFPRAAAHEIAVDPHTLKEPGIFGEENPLLIFC